MSPKILCAFLNLYQLESRLNPNPNPNYPKPFLSSAPLHPLQPALTHQARIMARPNLKAYLESDRCGPFTKNGIFRDYPELEEGLQ